MHTMCFSDRFNVVPELQCFTKGFRLLTSHMKYTDIFSEIPRNEFLKALRITRGFAEMVKSMENNTDTSSGKINILMAMFVIYFFKASLDIFIFNCSVYRVRHVY